VSTELLPLLALLGLGALHGLNPGMGWLFAVALGFQEGRARAVWRALPPLAAGHGLAIVLALAVLALAGAAIPLDAVKWAVAALLVAIGAWRLVRHRHPRVGGMRVGSGTLTLWSFLMATAHGAGLMVLPVVLQASHATTGHAHHAHGPSPASLLGDGRLGVFGASAVHTASYLLVTGILAFLVFRKLGLRRLTSLWFNVDFAWAVALIVTGVLTAMA
jgi:hypothetical protein